MMRAFLFSLLLASGAYAQTSNENGFIVEFSKGLNMRDNPASIGQGYYTGNSYNIDPQPDGSAKKRPGLYIDYNYWYTDLTGQTAYSTSTSYDKFNTGISLIKWIGQAGGFVSNVASPYRKLERTLIVDGDNFFGRNNDDTYYHVTWSIVTGTDEGGKVLLESPNRTGYRRPKAKSEWFNGRLIVGGSGLSRMVQTDGITVSSLFMPAEQDGDAGSASVSAGGSLTDSTYYCYVMTFVNEFGEESFATDTMCATTSESNKTITLTGLPIFPSYNYSGVDTAKHYTRNIYRSCDTLTANISDLYYLSTIYTNDTTFTDDGSVSVSTILAPSRAKVYQSFQYPTEYNDFLWLVGEPRYVYSQLTPVYDLVGGLTAADSVYLRVTHKWGKRYVVKSQLSTGGYSTTALGSLYKLDCSTCDFVRNSVAVGDIVGSVSKVVSVLSDTSLIINLDVSGNITIGNNYYYDGYPDFSSSGNTSSEIFVIANELSSNDSLHTIKMQITRNLNYNRYNTAMYIGDNLFRLNPQYSDQYLYYTSPLNAQQIQNLGIDGVHMPIGVAPGVGGKITGLVKGGGSLLIFKEYGTYALSGTSWPFTIQTISNTTGCLSDGSLQPYGSGAIALGSSGINYVSTDGIRDIGNILGNAVFDSLSLGYIDSTCSIVYNNKYYLSGVRNSSTYETNIWAFDATNNNWTRYKGTYVLAMGISPSASERYPRLFMSDWRSRCLYKLAPEYYYDTDTSGAQVNIETQIITPAFSFFGSEAEFQELVLNIDSADSVWISVTVSQKDTISTWQALHLNPADGDTSYSAGSPRMWIVPINAIGNTCQITIKSSGKKRMVVHPGFLKAKRIRI